MQTSYFANLKNVKNPLSISGKCPDWYNGPEFKVLAPKYSFLSEYKSGIIDADVYTVNFNDLLSRLNTRSVWDHLVTTYGEDVTLLCYEKPGDFCHRRLVADWFKRELGYDVNEAVRPSKIVPILSTDI